MTHIFLVRHGEVAGNSGARRTLVGWGDPPLTARGEAQAQAVARRLRRETIQAVYVSDLQRARRTAEYIADEHGLSAQCDAAWREICFGAWEGLSEAEITADWSEQWQQRQADPVQVSAPDGESLNDVWARLQPAWQQIVRDHQDGMVALVGHNTTLRLLLCHLLAAPVASYRRIHLSNCGVSRVEVGPTNASGTESPVVVSYINDTSHLADI